MEGITAGRGSKAEVYLGLIPQLRQLVTGERSSIANMGNITAALKQVFNFLWVGFYVVEDGDLVLGPFQGTVACTRIPFGKGVCGTAWKEKRIVTVPNVDAFEGHIACSSASRSEIVVPLMNADGEVTAVLDIDSDSLNNFDEVDAHYLNEIISSLLI
jgi:GAF domain-containing protein